MSFNKNNPSNQLTTPTLTRVMNFKGFKLNTNIIESKPRLGPDLSKINAQKAISYDLNDERFRRLDTDLIQQTFELALDDQIEIRKTNPLFMPDQEDNLFDELNKNYSSSSSITNTHASFSANNKRNEIGFYKSEYDNTSVDDQPIYRDPVELNEQDLVNNFSFMTKVDQTDFEYSDDDNQSNSIDLYFDSDYSDVQSTTYFQIHKNESDIIEEVSML
jgi:hypothetical protein